MQLTPIKIKLLHFSSILVESLRYTFEPLKSTYKSLKFLIVQNVFVLGAVRLQNLKYFILFIHIRMDVEFESL